MAQPTFHIIKYTGSYSIKAGKTYQASQLGASGNVLIMKTSGVSVSINGNDAFLTSFDDKAYIDTSATYIFDKDCVIAVGDMVEVI